MFSFSNNKLVNSAPFKLWLTTCGARKSLDTFLVEN